ncbi:hypothetical protein MSAN_00074500 [Mycena sanguinolenta]|uniref:Uncharacterized protein n=1 Tax=Mycena sanguinolenta TaxID=230812 RepID=A0A8H6ZHU6_9AGAR|nr:hypothetical protein MSAN_00074500 [Mycena sanguinolenta]
MRTVFTSTSLLHGSVKKSLKHVMQLRERSSTMLAAMSRIWLQSSSPLLMPVTFHTRLAFTCVWHCCAGTSDSSTVSTHSGEKSMTKWKNSAKGGSQAFVDLMEDIYEDDVRDFKDPSTTEHVLKSFSDPSFVCPQWLRELHKLAPQVKRLPKQKSKKRKRVVPEDDAGDDETPNNLSHHDENQIPEADDQLPESEEASGAGQELEES